MGTVKIDSHRNEENNKWRAVENSAIALIIALRWALECSGPLFVSYSES